MVDEVMTSVKGGTLLSAVSMRAKLNRDGVMDLATYQEWARTITEAPALLHSEVQIKVTARREQVKLKYTYCINVCVYAGVTF